MGRKVFVSYKYQDSNVRQIDHGTPPSWPCDYVGYTEENVLQDHIYKGEKQDEDLSYYSDDYIWTHLKNKILDSSITVLLISPNMREKGRWDRSQWIPWELAYSVRETTRADRTSHRNSIVAVCLPDKNGSYTYFDKNSTFSILKKNLDNGYIYLTDWDFFKLCPDYCFDKADDARRSTPE